MYANAKMIPVETFQELRGRGEGKRKEVKESSGGGEFKYDVFDTL
jgi:hypothetical protein